jgi:hypothetical protein
MKLERSWALAHLSDASAPTMYQILFSATLLMFTPSSFSSLLRSALAPFSDGLYKS